MPSAMAKSKGEGAAAGAEGPKEGVDLTKILTPAWLSEADGQLRTHELLLIRFGKKQVSGLVFCACCDQVGQLGYLSRCACVYIYILNIFCYFLSMNLAESKYADANISTSHFALPATRRPPQGINKKKDAKEVGVEIAKEVGATVAQVVGHTVLLYRPANPPAIDLNVEAGGGVEVAAETDTEEEGVEGDGIEG